MGAPDVRIVAGRPDDDEVAAVVAVLGALLAARTAPPPAPPRHRTRRARVACAAVHRPLRVQAPDRPSIG